MRGEVGGTHNRPRHKLGKERHVERIVHQRTQRTDVAAVNIDDVTHALEREKTYANRQENVPGLEVVPYHRGQHTGKEVGVLEVSQQPQVNKQTQKQQHLHLLHVAIAARFHTSDAFGYEVIARRHHRQEEEIKTAALIIKVVGEERYKQNAQVAAPLKQHVNERNAEEQVQEQSAAEYQGALRIICKDAD